MKNPKGKSGASGGNFSQGHDHHGAHHSKGKFDYLLWGSH